MDTVALVLLDFSHAPAMLRWMRDPDVARNLGIRSEPSLEKTEAFLARVATDPDLFARAIMDDGNHVGNVVLDHVDRHTSTARLHIYIGEPSARGRGVGGRAVERALAIAFGDLGLNKVWLTVHARNEGAIAAYRRVGFQIEGTHRQEFVLDGERIDELYMGILATDRSP